MNIVYLKWNDVVKNNSDFIKYAFKTSDSFSLTYQMCYPYSRNQIKYCNKEIADRLSCYLIKQFFSGDEYIKNIPKKNVLNTYVCNKGTREIIKYEELFAYNIDGLEDICFYRNNQLWFNSTTHEQEAIFCDPTENDLLFLREQKIQYQE